MVRKPKETPHLRLRVEPALLARLEKSAKENGHTLTGEIVTRLEQSFHFEEKIDAFRALWQARTDELLRKTDQARSDLEESQKRLDEISRDYAELEKKLDQNIASANMVDVLLGEDKQKSEMLRRLAVDIASWPEDWATNPAFREEISQRFRDSFRGAA